MSGHATPEWSSPPEDCTGREFAAAYEKRLGDALAAFYLAFAFEMDSHTVSGAFDAAVGVMAEMESEWAKRLARRESDRD